MRTLRWLVCPKINSQTILTTDSNQTDRQSKSPTYRSFMTLPKKRRRNIVVDNEHFCWIDNYLTKRDRTVAIQSASGDGPLLKGIILTRLKPSDVELAIRFAKDRGWNPSTGSEFELFINTDDSPPKILELPKFVNSEHRKRWVQVATTLETARRILSYSVKKPKLDGYFERLFRNELEAAVIELSSIAGHASAAQGFWLRLLQVAVQLDIPELEGKIRAATTCLETDLS